MEKYRETSERDHNQVVIMWIMIIGLCVWLGYEVNGFLNHHGSLIGIGYVPFMAGLLVWRYCFHYTYILTNTEMVVITEGLGIKRTFTVELSKTESFADIYKKKFFRQTGIRRYRYLYSSVDGRPTRIFIFRENGKMSAVLFKVSDNFMNELAAMMPTQYLRFQEEK